MILLRGESVVEKHRVTDNLYSHTDCAHLSLVPGSPSAQTQFFVLQAMESWAGPGNEARCVY